MCMQLAAGVIAIGQMMTAMIIKTGQATAGAIQSYAQEHITRTPPAAQPVMIPHYYKPRYAEGAVLCTEDAYCKVLPALQLQAIATFGSCVSGGSLFVAEAADVYHPHLGSSCADAMLPFAIILRASRTCRRRKLPTCCLV